MDTPPEFPVNTSANEILSRLYLEYPNWYKLIQRIIISFVEEYNEDD